MLRFDPKTDRARALYERATEIKPQDYQSVCLLSQIYEALGRKQESERAARQGLKHRLLHRHLERRARMVSAEIIGREVIADPVLGTPVTCLACASIRQR